MGGGGRMGGGVSASQFVCVSGGDGLGRSGTGGRGSLPL